MGPKNPKFESFFSKTYGARWPAIYQALIAPPRHILRKNAFAAAEAFNEYAPLKPSEFLPGSGCFDGVEHVDSDGVEHVDSDGVEHVDSDGVESLNRAAAPNHPWPNGVDSNGRKLFYKMDLASVLVARSLRIQPHDDVLDLCAAPGGKSLLLAEALNGSGTLTSNEFSNSRRDRLVRVFQEYLAREQRENIFVKGQDGNAYGVKFPQSFDAVLADVPCTGERHLLQNVGEFSVWSEKRSQNIAVRQYSLLSSAWLTAKSGGQIVYSTCSLSPFENDDVIKKLIKRRAVKVIRADEPDGTPFVEQTEFGYRILPDSAWFGPMYFSILLKT